MTNLEIVDVTRMHPPTTWNASAPGKDDHSESIDVLNQISTFGTLHQNGVESNPYAK